MVQSTGAIADTVIDLVGTIGRRILADPMPDHRMRTRPRVAKRAISKYNAEGTVDRTSPSRAPSPTASPVRRG
ncbi:hypothetical protein [Streptomyces sp. NPDC059894]|uniref:hypothetical protein n=1 Tax=unclassified Streptomyces TaxID=2593676 RepID=UPI003655079F